MGTIEIFYKKPFLWQLSKLFIIIGTNQIISFEIVFTHIKENLFTIIKILVYDPTSLQMKKISKRIYKIYLKIIS